MAIGRAVAKHVMLFPVLALAMSCASGDADKPTAAVGTTAQAISGGTTGSEHAGVVAVRIQYDGYNGLCTGSLIAQNLVLTARHCIAPTKPGNVACGEPAFQAPYPPSASRVTTSASALSTDAAVVEVTDVWVPPGDDACGMDVALLVLEGAGIDASVAAPLVPRIDREVTPAETYTAIGYGSTAAGGVDGAGTRRTRRGLSVNCIGASCDSVNVAKTEWRGETGTCIGDSGGPALDADAKVIGVLSRSTATCDDPEYGSVVAWKDWLVEHARIASEKAGVAPPSWAMPVAAATDADAAAPVGAGPDPAPVAAPKEESRSSCAIVPKSERGSFGAWAVALGAMMAVMIRRRVRALRR